MTMADFFDHYWWLIFPIFGMAMGVWGMVSSERRAKSALEVIKSYVEQGKEPPPELLRLAQDNDGSGYGDGLIPRGRGNSSAWNVVTFLALAAGFGVGYWWVRDEGYAYAFLIVAVTMAVLAVGGCIILMFGRK